MTATVPTPTGRLPLTPGRYITTTLRTYRIAPASPHGPAPRDLLVYAANGRSPVARIRYGTVRWTSAPRVETDLAELLADPRAAARRYAGRTGRCARCARPISGPGPWGPECVKETTAP